MMRLSVEDLLLFLRAYLNPLFREMEFISDMKKRSEHRLKAEEFAIKMLRKSILKKPVTVEDATQINDVGLLVSSLESGVTDHSESNNKGGRKRPFNLMERADSVPN